VAVRASRGGPCLTSVLAHLPAQNFHNSFLHSLGGVVFRARTRGPCFSTTYPTSSRRAREAAVRTTAP